ncbi:MAG: hypothetical protein MjAS7_0132 [Metallosphaera javensis (ex Sakai et al. 2022)]|nr:MAG: hypothetical protein MjAS7_0132 [Metallosphaera javensis (ex Sakai et al. 2022)]
MTGAYKSYEKIFIRVSRFRSLTIWDDHPPAIVQFVAYFNSLGVKGVEDLTPHGTPQIQFMKKSLELYFRLEERM